MKVINIKGIKKYLDTYKISIEVFINEDERNLILDSLKLNKELEIRDVDSK